MHLHPDVMAFQFFKAEYLRALRQVPQLFKQLAFKTRDLEDEMQEVGRAPEPPFT